MLATSEPFAPSRAQKLALFGLGLLLAIVASSVTLAIGPLEYHSARSDELTATVEAYERTGVLLIKETGSGSNYTQAPSDAPLSPAAWDDDPGSYLSASLVVGLTGVEDPYRALLYLQALLVAVPMLWLPWTLAALFRRTRAGLAAAVLPLLVPLLKGAPLALLGTDYGLTGPGVPTPVYALYGLASSTLFAVLSLLLLAASRRRSPRQLVGAVVVFGLLAGLCGLMRAWSGIGVVVGVALLVALHARGARRALVGVTAAVAALGISLATQAGVMSVLNADRAEATGMAVAELPVAHGTWHPLYLGLSYSGVENLPEPSVLGIRWDDRFGWDKARQVDPDVVIASNEYDAILKDFYLRELRTHPVAVAKMYVTKAVDAIWQNGLVLLVIVAGLALTWRRPSVGPAVRRASLLLAPTLAYAFVPAVLVMPLRYYFLELTAVTGLLLAVVVGGLAARTAAHRRPAARCANAECGPGCRAPEEDVDLSVIVPTRNGSGHLAATLTALGDRLGPGDEILVVENGSTDGTWGCLREFAAGWPSTGPELRLLRCDPGLGRAYGHGAAHSRGRRCLFTADDLPFGFTDLDGFTRAPQGPVLIGSKAHPDSHIDREPTRSAMSRGFRLLRRLVLGDTVGDTQGTFYVDGPWARAFAAHAHEIGLLWTTELVTAARAQKLSVREVPVILIDSHAGVRSRFSWRSAVGPAVGLLRLAARRPSLARQRWPLGTAAPRRLERVG
jgi:hypothetical protein